MRCVKRWCLCVARPGIRDLGNDYPTRVEVCMYRTIAHLPPETLLRNEVTEVRSRDGRKPLSRPRRQWEPISLDTERIWHGALPTLIANGAAGCVRVVQAGGPPLAVLAATASPCQGDPAAFAGCRATRRRAAQPAVCWPSASRQAVPPGAQQAPWARAQASAMYAFGALLHRIAYGKRLHGELTWAQTLTAAKYAPLRPTLPPGVRAPPALMALMGCCLQREPSERPSFAEARTCLSFTCPPPVSGCTRTLLSLHERQDWRGQHACARSARGLLPGNAAQARRCGLRLSWWSASRRTVHLSDNAGAPAHPLSLLTATVLLRRA